jgi:hypothetical protein
MSKRAKQFFRMFLEPKAVIFGVALFHCLSMWVYAERIDWTSMACIWYGPWNFTYEPTLLLIAAGGLLLSRAWSCLIAVVAASRVIMLLGIGGLLAQAAAHGEPVLSVATFGGWWRSMYLYQPQYILQLALASVILCYASAVIVGRIRRWNHHARRSAA